MAENKLSFLKNAFSDYVVEFTDSFTHAVIVNPFCGDNIAVYYYEDDEHTPYCVCFSYQHCHLCDKENVVEWINEIIQGRLLAIEFFNGEQRCFGGDIEAEKLIDLSYETLEQHFGYFGSTKLLQIADSFKVRGWNSLQSFNAVFVYEGNGNIGIKQTYIR